jgi:hypothetical protein
MSDRNLGIEVMQLNPNETISFSFSEVEEWYPNGQITKLLYLGTGTYAEVVRKNRIKRTVIYRKVRPSER